jgi:hypothetical protein
MASDGASLLMSLIFAGFRRLGFPFSLETSGEGGCRILGLCGNRLVRHAPAGYRRVSKEAPLF